MEAQPKFLTPFEWNNESIFYKVHDEDGENFLFNKFQVISRVFF